MCFLVFEIVIRLFQWHQVEISELHSRPCFGKSIEYIWINLVCMCRSRSVVFHKQVFIFMLIIFIEIQFVLVNGHVGLTIHDRDEDDLS